MNPWLMTLFSAFETLSTQRFQFMNLQYLKTQSVRPNFLLQVKKGRHEDIRWTAQGDMATPRKNRKGSKTICQIFAQTCKSGYTGSFYNVSF